MTALVGNAPAIPSFRESTRMKATVIGLGAMGAGMAGNLFRAGHLKLAWNRSPERAQAAAAAHGFAVADSLDAAAGQADLVITSVSADSDLHEVVDRLAQVMTAGSIVLDTSTVSIETAREVSVRLAAHGIHFLDAPVSGGKEGAEKATMVMMVGGDLRVLEQVMPILQSISRKVVHMGAVGSGQATKAVNQIMCAGINQAVTEALAFGQHQGLDMDKAIDVVSSGAAGNWFVEHRGRSMTQGSFTPGFRVALHHKDLKICQAMLAADHTQLPMVEMTLVHYERLMNGGHGDEDISALYRLKRTLFGEGV
ncbi:MAG: NAD(P)-dependent oxidoreductase [Sedimenticolaceae bacterium]